MLASQSSAGSLWCLCAPASATVEEMAQLGEALCRPARAGAPRFWRWMAVSIVTVVGGSLVAYENSGVLNKKLAGLRVLGANARCTPDGASATSRPRKMVQQLSLACTKRFSHLIEIRFSVAFTSVAIFPMCEQGLDSQ